jgi:hypothetical protein
MMNELTLLIFTAFHVALSLIGIGAGAIAILGLLARQQYRFWNNLFLWITGITCITGFFFPFHGITPGIVIGVVCLLALVVAVFADSVASSRRILPRCASHRPSM